MFVFFSRTIGLVLFYVCACKLNLSVVFTTLRGVAGLFLKIAHITRRRHVHEGTAAVFAMLQKARKSPSVARRKTLEG